MPFYKLNFFYKYHHGHYINEKEHKMEYNMLFVLTFYTSMYTTINYLDKLDSTKVQDVYNIIK